MPLNNNKSLQPRTLRTLMEAGFTGDQIRLMSSTEIIDAVLSYEGIIGFTDRIIELVLTTKRATGEIRYTDKEKHHG